MYDKAEHRVAMHQIARERAAQGKRRWAKTIDVKAFIHDKYDPDPAVNAYHLLHNVADRLIVGLPHLLDPAPENDSYNAEFADLLEEMKDRTVEGLRDLEDLDNFVNLYLEDVYDVLDYNHVWAGDGIEKNVTLYEAAEEPAAPGP